MWGLLAYLLLCLSFADGLLCLLACFFRRQLRLHSLLQIAYVFVADISIVIPALRTWGRSIAYYWVLQLQIQMLLEETPQLYHLERYYAGT